MSTPTPELEIGTIQYYFDFRPQTYGHKHRYTARLKNCDPTLCKVFLTMDSEGREMPLEEFGIPRSGELSGELIGNKNTYHMYLFCGKTMIDQFKYKVGFETIHEFCKDPKNGCTITKETIHAVQPPSSGGRHRKSHRRSRGSKRSGSKRSGSKRSGSKRSGSKRSGSKRSGSKRRRC